MLKEHSSFVKQAVAVVDILLLVVSFWVAYFLISTLRPLSPIWNYWVMFIGFLGFYLYFAWTRGLFSLFQFNWVQGLLRNVIMIFLSAGLLGAAILYLGLDDYSSRSLYLVYALTSFVFIGTEKFFLKELIAYVRRNNRNTTPVLLFGRGKTASRIRHDICTHPQWGLRIIKTVDVSATPEEFERVLKYSYVEEVFFCIPRDYMKNGFELDTFLRICEEMGRPARMFLNITTATNFARWQYHQFMDFPTVISHTVELDPDQLIFKRGFDIAGSLFGLLILGCCYPFIACAIRLTSRGPILFRQIRVGKNGKRFVMYKFRTMFEDAEERKKELAAKNELNGAVFKMKNDPRVTPVGRILRRCSLDELPQFMNVLRGEMSLVGTRPPTPDEVAKYQKWQFRRISIRPGITGLWQVSGRNRIREFDEIVQLDLQYIDSWTIVEDIKILLRTMVVLFHRDQAY